MSNLKIYQKEDEKWILDEKKARLKSLKEYPEPDFNKIEEFEKEIRALENKYKRTSNGQIELF